MSAILFRAHSIGASCNIYEIEEENEDVCLTINWINKLDEIYK